MNSWRKAADDAKQPMTQSRSLSKLPLTGKDTAMLRYTAWFVVVALLAALFGFGGIAAGVAAVAKLLFFVFMLVAIMTLLLSFTRE